jgi:hypothetical protein
MPPFSVSHYSPRWSSPMAAFGRPRGVPQDRIVVLFFPRIDKIAFTHDMKDDFTVEELERPFLMAKALGAPRIASSTTLSVARRLVPLMARHQVEVAFHGHTNTAGPNEFAGLDSFRRALAMSPFARINLDIGQFLGAGFDAIPFIEKQHAKIPVLHIRDGQRGSVAKCHGARTRSPSKACCNC